MTKAKRVAVPEEDRAKLLLWCARHCCFCGKECTTNIVIHHIDGDPSNNDLDNLMPVCFDCHGELERYNPEHPVGTRYRYLEIKKRRNRFTNCIPSHTCGRLASQSASISMEVSARGLLAIPLARLSPSVTIFLSACG
jgi:hypothetical protein